MAAISHHPKVSTFEKTYPKSVSIGGVSFTCRLMTSQDRHLVLTLAQQLPESDLLFMRQDITQPEEVDRLVRDLEANRMAVILVEDGRDIVACGTLTHNRLFWNRHWAELCVTVRSPYRNRGLGTQIAAQLMEFARQKGLEKVVAYTLVEDKGAQHMFEGLRFKPEAILPDWVKTRDNHTHDLLLMACALGDNQHG